MAATLHIFTVETYTLTASNGRPIRKATRVIAPNGQVVDFIERLPKRDAIEQAIFHLAKRGHMFPKRESK